VTICAAVIQYLMALTMFCLRRGQLSNRLGQISHCCHHAANLAANRIGAVSLRDQRL
jgi:hypothetical protein